MHRRIRNRLCECMSDTTAGQIAYLTLGTIFSPPEAGLGNGTERTDGENHERTHPERT